MVWYPAPSGFIMEYGETAGRGNVNRPESSSLYSPLSISKELWPWCLWVICLLTMAWTSVVAWVEVSSGNHQGILETSIVVGANTSDAVPLIVVYSVLVVVVVNFIKGGGIVVTARAAKAYFDDKIERRRERLRAEGRAEGRAILAAEVEDWNRRRLEAEERGERFDEPPPS